MAEIQIGDSTHHHDQVMTPASLSAINAISATSTMVEGIKRRHERRRSIRMPGTLPAYGVGAEKGRPPQLGRPRWGMSGGQLRTGSAMMSLD